MITTNTLLASVLLLNTSVSDIPAACSASKLPTLYISERDVREIVTLPNKSSGSADGSYRLEISVFSSKRKGTSDISLNIPRRGQISDIEFLDVDQDGSRELVIQQTRQNKSQTVNCIDVFELQPRLRDTSSPMSILFDAVQKIKGEF